MRGNTMKTRSAVRAGITPHPSPYTYLQLTRPEWRPALDTTRPNVIPYGTGYSYGEWSRIPM
jgi:hypothetical protein